MFDILLTPGGDLYVDSTGNISLTDSIIQAVLIRLKWFLGEWLLNPDLGVAYFQYILGKNPDTTRIKTIISQQILSVTGVIDIQSLELTADSKTRSLNIDFVISTTQGIYQQELPLYGAAA